MQTFCKHVAGLRQKKQRHEYEPALRKRNTMMTKKASAFAQSNHKSKSTKWDYTAGIEGDSSIGAVRGSIGLEGGSLIKAASQLESSLMLCEVRVLRSLSTDFAGTARTEMQGSIRPKDALPARGEQSRVRERIWWACAAAKEEQIIEKPRIEISLSGRNSSRA
ncbi:hypothetical protein Nepgr_005895 [Nepenthes gracilis]|uniref:Uncharacterized protein n=1 Tax=Nepenthes gracilis TaxID=150966 RepID=A0AAD3S4F0_NEPGR|nr:hypothetical protein Nepgr_005895 [Nepenthes gracilis]